MLQLTVRKVGNSLGMILPAEAVRELNLSEGDRLFLTKSPEGLRLTPYDPSFEKKMEIARKGMRKYRNALRELAK
jgi:putative addiction module antidote